MPKKWYHFTHDPTSTVGVFVSHLSYQFVSSVNQTNLANSTNQPGKPNKNFQQHRCTKKKWLRKPCTKKEMGVFLIFPFWKFPTFWRFQMFPDGAVSVPLHMASLRFFTVTSMASRNTMDASGKTATQVIQSELFWSLSWRSFNPFKGSLNHGIPLLSPNVTSSQSRVPQPGGQENLDYFTLTWWHKNPPKKTAISFTSCEGRIFRKKHRTILTI